MSVPTYEPIEIELDMSVTQEPCPTCNLWRNAHLTTCPHCTDGMDTRLMPPLYRPAPPVRRHV